MMQRPFTRTKVNARIAAGRSVLTRKVVDRDGSQLHNCILKGDRGSAKATRHACMTACLAQRRGTSAPWWPGDPARLFGPMARQSHGAPRAEKVLG